jgi:hypothetical protein
MEFKEERFLEQEKKVQLAEYVNPDIKPLETVASKPLGYFVKTVEFKKVDEPTQTLCSKTSINESKIPTYPQSDIIITKQREEAKNRYYSYGDEKVSQAQAWLDNTMFCEGGRLMKHDKIDIDCEIPYDVKTVADLRRFAQQCILDLQKKKEMLEDEEKQQRLFDLKRNFQDKQLQIEIQSRKQNEDKKVAEEKQRRTKVLLEEAKKRADDVQREKEAQERKLIELKRLEEAAIAETQKQQKLHDDVQKIKNEISELSDSVDKKKKDIETSFLNSYVKVEQT